MSGAFSRAPGPAWRHTHVDEVRFGDLDAMRHLNNAVFLTFFESARVEYLAELVPEHVPTEPDDFGLIFAECHINYRSPGRFAEQIQTRLRASNLARSSFRLDFEMRSEADGRLLAEGYGVLVGYDYTGERAAPLPARLSAKLEAEVAAVA